MHGQSTTKTTSICCLLQQQSLFISVGLLIGCFQCQSYNGSNPRCEDPFDSRNKTYEDFYVEDCMSGTRTMENILPQHERKGLYYATDCIKISGVYSKSHALIGERQWEWFPEFKFSSFHSVLPLSLVDCKGKRD